MMNRVDYLVTEIGSRIVGGDFDPGSTLPIEQELSEAYDVGRNVVREAVKVLAGKGIVRTERRAGTIVQPHMSWAMLDPDVISWMLQNPNMRQELLIHLSQFRQMIEPEAAALAASQASIVHTLRLFEAYENMEKNRYQRDLAVAADIQFHERLLEASQNPLFGSMARSINMLLEVNFEITIEQPDGYIHNLEQHGKVAEAIHRRDPDSARQEMQILLSNNDADLEKMLQKSHTAEEKA